MNKRLAWIAVVPALTIGAVLWVAQPLPGKPAPQPAHAASPERLRTDVERLAGTYRQRHHGQPEVLDRAARFIGAEFAAAGGRVEMQVYEVGGFTYANVIARFGPDAGRPIIVGAHYDVEEHTPGADDNASGVAGLLEIARLLGKAPPTVPVELVAYTLEEPPHFRTEHMGSRHHAARLAEAGVSPRLTIVLEMIGYFDDRPGSQTFPVPLMDMIYPDSGSFIAVVGNFTGAAETRRVKAAMTAATPLPVWSINAPSWLPGVDFSDHASYWRLGMPAVMVTDTAFYRNGRYHQGDDTPDTLDYRRMAQVVSGVMVAIRQAEA